MTSMQQARANEKIFQKLPGHLVCLPSEIQIEQRQVAGGHIAARKIKFNNSSLSPASTCY
jgi:hypothetical protein